MSMSKELAKYPPQFFDLAEEMKRRGRVEVKLESRAKASALRFRLYGFKAALRLAEMHGQYPEFHSCLIVVERDGTLVLLMPEADESMRALEAALRGDVTDEPVQRSKPRSISSPTESKPRSEPLSSKPAEMLVMDDKEHEAEHSEDAVRAFLQGGGAAEEGSAAPATPGAPLPPVK